MLCFGGSGLGKKFKDFWNFNLETKKWSKISNPGHPPSARDGHCCGLIKNKYMFVYGGIDENDNNLSDVYLYDLETHQW